MDFHGWNFTGAGSFGAPQARMNVVPGTRIAERVGTQVAVSSQPIVVNAREGGVREAIRTYVREAPRVIERAAGPDSERLAPVLARDRTLPADTLAALRERVVVAERGRLTGPAAAEIAPRTSAFAVERSRALPSVSAGRAPVAAERWRTSERGPAGADQPQARIVPRAGASETWRARGNPSSALAREVAPRERATAPERQSEIPRTDRAEGRPPVVSHESWRSRPDLPPARRVIEGAVPERRAPERRSEPIPRERIERAPVSLPPPARVERPASAPPPAHVDRGPANPAPPAPAPRSEVRHESAPQRSAPAPQAERGRPN
jgi:hypothetical protein